MISLPNDDGLNDALTNINFPGVALLATSGVVALIFIVRWMIKFQRDFTNFYVDENNKLRERIDAGEIEAAEKADILRDVKNDTLERELKLIREINDLKITVSRQGATIEQQGITIETLRQRLNGNH